MKSRKAYYLLEPIPETMSQTIGEWICRVQYLMPKKMQKMEAWQNLLGLALSTDRMSSKEKKRKVMIEEWNRRLNSPRSPSFVNEVDPWYQPESWDRSALWLWGIAVGLAIINHHWLGCASAACAITASCVAAKGRADKLMSQWLAYNPIRLLEELILVD